MHIIINFVIIFNRYVDYCTSRGVYKWIFIGFRNNYGEMDRFNLKMTET